jgi:hypothetical protein
MSVWHFPLSLIYGVFFYHVLGCNSGGATVPQMETSLNFSPYAWVFDIICLMFAGIKVPYDVRLLEDQ